MDGKLTLKPVIGFGICQRCKQQYAIHEGERRRYCLECELVVEREGGATGGRPPKPNPAN